MNLDTDFHDLICELNAANCEYLIVGAFAMSIHGIPRYTGDLDLFYRPAPENAMRILQALENFGYKSPDLTLEALLEPDTVFYFGRPPLRVDLLNAISGVSFEEAWATRVYSKVNNLEVAVLSLEALSQNKRSTGRIKDLVDVEMIEKQLQ